VLDHRLRDRCYGYGYDAVNRLIRETDQEGVQVNLTRDGQGEVTAEDPLNLQTTYVRNGFGEVIRQRRARTRALRITCAMRAGRSRR
jgi:YD repeat-containing protein